MPSPAAKTPRVHVVAAEVAGRVTRTPTERLSDLFGAAARNAWARARDLLGAEPPLQKVYLGAMGGFAEEEFLGVSPLNVGAKLQFLQSRLDRVRVLPAFTGTSDIGAQVLHEAWRALDADAAPQTVLVLSGEQMEPTTEQTRAEAERAGAGRSVEAIRAAQRTRRNVTVSRVIDGDDRAYGLTMPRAGDLFLDLIVRGSGLAYEDVRYLLLPHLASAKYRRGHAFAPAQLGDDYPSGIAMRDYYRGALLGKYLSLHDCAPISSTACAVVLTTDPAVAARAPARLLGMGWGAARRPSVPRRRESGMDQGAVRDALRRCVDAAGLASVEALARLDFAVVHDAFPSIEYLFLRGMGLSHKDVWLRMLSGWSNPFGGLKVCGHALGASGLLQVVAAWHLMRRAALGPGGPPAASYASAVPEVCGPARTAVFTSLGSTALTAVAGVLAADDAAEEALRAAFGADGAPVTGPSGPVPAGAAAGASELSPGEGEVVASLPLRFSREFGDDALFEAAQLAASGTNHLALVDWHEPNDDGALVRTFALCEEPVTWGERVHVSVKTGRDRVARRFATPRPVTHGAHPAPPPAAARGEGTLTVEELVALEQAVVRDFPMEGVERIEYLPPERIGDLPIVLYALVADGGLGRVYRARLTEPWEGMARGSVVAVKMLPFDDGRAKARGREEVLAQLAVRAHPNIVAILFAEPIEHAGQPVLVVVMEHVWGWRIGDTLGRMTPGLGDADRLRHLPRMALQGLRALRAMRQAGVEHREINPRNVMVTYDGELKILDWAVGTVPGGEADEGLRLRDGGTLPWVAPERLVTPEGGPYDRSLADAWCLGVTLVDFAAKTPFLAGEPRLVAALRTLAAPRSGWDDAALHEIHEVLQARVQRAFEGRAGEPVLDATRDVLARLCEVNPANRGSLDAAMARLEEGLTTQH